MVVNSKNKHINISVLLVFLYNMEKKFEKEKKNFTTKYKACISIQLKIIIKQELFQTSTYFSIERFFHAKNNQHKKFMNFQ